jgi:hypothetical protein
MIGVRDEIEEKEKRGGRPGRRETYYYHQGNGRNQVSYRGEPAKNERN